MANPRSNARYPEAANTPSDAQLQRYFVTRAAAPHRQAAQSWRLGFIVSFSELYEVGEWTVDVFGITEGRGGIAEQVEQCQQEIVV